MVSQLTWVDHDPEARERALRIIAVLEQREARDELGLGGVRDSFADQLFPGTSTIQTRLRYMLFVPWVYQALEHGRVPASQFAARARRAELDLVEPLMASDDRSGIFGIQARGRLRRLPSSVYWSGLGSWGILRFDGSQDEYHRHIDLIYRRRERLRDQPEDAAEQTILQAAYVYRNDRLELEFRG